MSCCISTGTVRLRQVLERDRIGCVLLDDVDGDRGRRHGARHRRRGARAGGAGPARPRRRSARPAARRQGADRRRDAHGADRAAGAGDHRPRSRDPAGSDRPCRRRYAVRARPRPARTDHRRPRHRQDDDRIDTIINQKTSDIVCVYVAVGQKSSSVRAARSTRSRPAARRSAASSSSPERRARPGLQWIAPFAGFTMAEYFRDRGQHALVVIDDLTKHAATHREIALLTRQSPGREAYPGDVFYVHAGCWSARRSCPRRRAAAR
jgi:F-type H+-transporting ATPase subunit alpha